MKRRDFLQTMGAAAAGGMLARAPLRSAKKLQRIGLETYAVRHAMAQDPDRTLAAIRAIGYTDVELLWSFNLFGRTPQQVADTLKKEGLRAPSAHMSADTVFVGWEPQNYALGWNPCLGNRMFKQIQSQQTWASDRTQSEPCGCDAL